MRTIIVRSDYSLLTLVSLSFLPGNAFHNPMAIKTHPINPIPMRMANIGARSKSGNSVYPCQAEINPKVNR